MVPPLDLVLLVVLVIAVLLYTGRVRSTYQLGRRSDLAIVLLVIVLLLAFYGNRLVR